MLWIRIRIDPAKYEKQINKKYWYGLDPDPEPDPHGSEIFAWIQIRNLENSKLDPDLE